MTRQAYDEFWNCKRRSHLCLIALKLKKMFGPLFGGSKDSRQVNTTTTSSKMCSLRGQSFGFGKPNVFPRSSSLDGSCSLTDLTQGICWKGERNSCRKATTASCVKTEWKRLHNIFFFQCTSAASRWFALGITWDEHSNIHQKLYLARNEFRQPFFMDIFLIGAWCLWTEGNDYIFKNKPPSIVAWKASVKYTVTSHLIRIKQCYHNSILLWLEAL